MDARGFVEQPMKSQDFLRACTRIAAIRVFAGCLGLAVIVNVYILRTSSVYTNSYERLYLRNTGSELVSTESIPAERNNVKNDLIEKYHLDAHPPGKKPEAVIEPVREDLPCVSIPTYCTENKVPWPPCSSSGTKLPGGQSLCACTKNSSTLISYPEYVKTRLNKTYSSWKKSDVPVFFINLAQSLDRRVQLRESMEHIFSTVIRFPAVSAQSKKVQELQRLYQAKDESIMAVLLSQRGVLRMALRYCETKKKPYAIIMEDDASLSFSVFWRYQFDEMMLRAPKDWLSIQLGYTRMKLVDNRVPKPFYHKIGRDALRHFRDRVSFEAGFWKKSEWGAFAYAIKIEGMKKLLARSYHDMKMQCETLVADDCFLGFVPIDRYAMNSPLYRRSYLALPPLFGVNIDAHATHREKKDMNCIGKAPWQDSACPCSTMFGIITVPSAIKIIH